MTLFQVHVAIIIRHGGYQIDLEMRNKADGLNSILYFSN